MVMNPLMHSALRGKPVGNEATKRRSFITISNRRRADVQQSAALPSDVNDLHSPKFVITRP
jgi:hypothetical protein